jgi:hypothetical protein
MMNFKIKVLKFMIFVNERYIQEDWDSYTKTGKFFMYPVWFIHAVIIWLVSPLLIPQYILMNSRGYKSVMEAQATMSPEQIKEFNQVATRNFLTNKGSGKKKTSISKRK